MDNIQGITLFSSETFKISEVGSIATKLALRHTVLI